MVRQFEQDRAQCDEPGKNSGVPPPTPANWREMLAAMEARMFRAEEEARMYKRQVERLTFDAAAQPVPALVPIPLAGEVDREPLFERFQKQHPPTFEGSTDPLVAEQWMDDITSMCEVMKIEGADRVACATHMLREDARIWWAMTSQIRDVSTMSWEQFQGVFTQRYFNDEVRKSKRDELIGLIQGRLTVAEYVHAFDRLACFAPELVSSDQTRRDKFIGGLNGMIARDVGITLGLAETTYAQAIDRALYAEEAEERIARELAVRREHRRTVRNTGSQDGGGLSKLKRKHTESSISGRRKKLKGELA